MNKKLLLLTVPLLFWSCMVLAQPEPVRLVILHTNDLHSHLDGFSPESEYTPLTVNDDHTVGGFARIAALIGEEREKEGNKLLVLDAGDFLMGTFFAPLEPSTGFQLKLMKQMGFDMVTLGNHEFDFGPEVLAKILVSSCEGNSAPLLVASNLAFSKKDHGDDDLEALFENGTLKPYRIIERGGLRIGIFGILGYSAIHDAPLVRPARFKDPVKTAKKYARFLKNKEKADLVICLSHSGVARDKDGQWAGEDVELAKKVPGIDVIISGHTHTLIDDNLVVNGTPIVQTGAYGTGLGRLELEVKDGKVVHSDSRVIPINDAIPGDPQIQEKIDEQEKLISKDFLKSLDLEYSSIITETAFPVLCDEDTLLEQSNLGPLISDAIYSYLNRNIPGGVDVSLFAAGMVRDNILPGMTGKQSVADLFRVAPLGSGKDSIPGYPLARVYVTGKELKGILEILYIAPAGNKDNYIYFGGLRATYDPHKGLLHKITSIETGDPVKGFTPVDWSKHNTKLYSLSASVYLLQFVGIIKKLSHGLVRVTLKNEDGQPLKSIDDGIIDGNASAPGIQEVKEWIALVWFLQNQPDVNGDGIPDIPEYYRTGSPRLYEKPAQF